MPDVLLSSVDLAAVEDRFESAGITWQESHLLFATKHGTPVETRNFDRVWHRRIAKAGVSPFTTAGEPAVRSWPSAT